MGRMRCVLGLIGAVSLLVVGCSGASSAPIQSVPPAATPAASTGKFKVETVTAGLEHGWDIGFLPDGGILVPQRPGMLALARGGLPPSARAYSPAAPVLGLGGLPGWAACPHSATCRLFSPS